MKSWAASQASVFNGTCRVYAPYYNHAVLTAKDIKSAWDVAFADVEKAFRVYLTQWNEGRPFYIGGHAQGAVMALRLMKSFLAPGTELRKQFVASYLCGLVVYEDQLPLEIPAAEYAGQPGTCSVWSTVAADVTSTDADASVHF